MEDLLSIKTNNEVFIKPQTIIMIVLACLAIFAGFFIIKSKLS